MTVGQPTLGQVVPQLPMERRGFSRSRQLLPGRETTQTFSGSARHDARRNDRSSGSSDGKPGFRGECGPPRGRLDAAHDRPWRPRPGWDGRSDRRGHRFDEGRGIKFETFAERRVRGAMIDALRKEAWPRGVRRQRRELEAAREALRRETGAEPSLADLAARVGTDEQRLGRTIVRINTIESTSALASPDDPIESALPDVCLPPETPTPDRVYESSETRSACATRLRPAAARAQGDRALLLPRRHDEADWRGDRRQRIARLAAARARDSAAAEGARHPGAAPPRRSPRCSISRP